MSSYCLQHECSNVMFNTLTQSSQMCQIEVGMFALSLWLWWWWLFNLFCSVRFGGDKIIWRFLFGRFFDDEDFSLSVGKDMGVNARFVDNLWNVLCLKFWWWWCGSCCGVHWWKSSGDNVGMTMITIRAHHGLYEKMNVMMFLQKLAHEMRWCTQFKGSGHYW